jgi:hypothetical protein
MEDAPVALEILKCETWCSGLCVFAPWREMLLLIQGRIHTAGSGAIRSVLSKDHVIRVSALALLSRHSSLITVLMPFLDPRHPSPSFSVTPFIFINIVSKCL